MAWDSEKSKGSDLPSREWNDHVDDQKNHSERHQTNGSDELDVTNLSGQLSDAQKIEVAENLIDTLAVAGLLTIETNGDTATVLLENTDVDHNETSNRTHQGDDIEPETVVSKTLVGGTILSGELVE